MRAAVAILIAGLAASGAGACDYPGPPPGSGEARAEAGDILWAGFSDATDRYDHGILGDSIEAGGLRVRTADKGDCELIYILGEDRVFEDVAPRIVDLDGDGRNEVVVVETDLAQGASLAVYGLVDDALVKITATPHIGRTHRWLAPVGAADLDGDGRIEIAYVDRPHLARTLRVWRYENRLLTEVAAVSGLTNHRIGDRDILGGIRECGGAPEIITASADWSRLVATGFASGRLVSRDIGLNRPAQLRAAMDCR